jgi:hypothetical protein
MNKKFIFLFFFFLLINSVFAQSNSSLEITNKVNLISNSINNKEYNNILDLISENARDDLKKEFQENVFNNVLTFNQSIKSIDQLDNGTIKVSGRFSATGINWHVSGFRNYFIFENIDNSWKLLDSDFQNKIGSGYIVKLLGKIFLILIPILLLCFIFWIWMLIDVLNRSFNNKITWVLIIIFLGILGAILYFFIVRRKLKKKKELKS